MGDRYTLYAVTANATLIEAISQQSLEAGTEYKGEPSSGETYPRFGAITAQNPKGGFSTFDLAAALGQIGPTGVAISSLLAGLMLYEQLIAEGGTRATGAVHRKNVLTKGVVVPKSLTCQHQGDAVLSYDIFAAHDGTNNPVVATGSITLPAIVTGNKRFTLGVVEIGGVTLTGVTSVTIDFGCTVKQEGSDSNIWPDNAYIETIKPSITIEGVDPAWFDDVDLAGLAAAHANTTIQFRLREAPGTFAAYGGITLSAAGVAYPTKIFDASGNAPGTSGLKVDCIYDGTNSPVAFSVDEEPVG
ncbi:MAG: hypothetical protein IMZ55_00660 [Acidobacteria bacterium]|nr:hypothetical protein [Acidobacteriota bacterium]